MRPDPLKVWTPPAIRAAVGRILVEALGLDEAAVTDGASLVRDLGAESIDFLDIGFKCQQAFGVDLPARLIQDRLLEWRGLGVLARVLTDRYGTSVTPEELRTVAPATIAAVLRHCRERHGLARADGDEKGLAVALAERLLAEMGGMGLDLSDLTPQALARPLMENLHSPAAVGEVLNRFTVRALCDYLGGQLATASRPAARA